MVNARFRNETLIAVCWRVVNFGANDVGKVAIWTNLLVVRESYSIITFMIWLIEHYFIT